MNGFGQDLKHALRVLRRAPAFAAAAVAVLAIGIGATTALFSVIDAALLRPMPFAASDHLVAIVTSERKLHFRAAASPPDFLDFRTSVPGLEQVAATAPWEPSATGDRAPERLKGLFVSPSFFPMLGIRAAAGRVFAADEEKPGRERVVVVGDALWKRRYGSDPHLVGKSLLLNGDPYTVVGIAPAGFRWGRAYGQNAPAEIWAPFALTAERIAADQRGNEYLDLIGRLRPGTSIAAAQTQVDALLDRFRHEYPAQFPKDGGMTTTLVPLQTDVVGDARGPLWILFGAVGFLLLLACTNVAGLQLARAAGRRAEMAIRVSLGARKAHLVRQLFAESSVLAGIAGVAGTALAAAGLGVIARHAPEGVPGLDRLRLDPATIVFALAITALSALLFGLAPAWGAARRDLRREIEEGRGVSARSSGRARRVLVAGQLGLATLLLVGAGLLVASLTRVLRVDPGFDPRRVITGQLALPRSRYPEREDRTRFREAVLERLRATPGVRDAGAVSHLPMAGSGNSGSFDIDGKPASGGRQPHAELWAATPGYFPAMRIPLLRGRLFGPSDSASSLPVAIVDDVLAKTYFGAEDPIGKRIDFEGDADHRSWRTVVGVVRTIKAHSLDDTPRPALYTPFTQSHEPILTLVARVEGSPGSFARAVRQAVAAVDADQPLGAVLPLEELLSESVAQRRLSASVLAGFAAVAVLLAAIGLYGALAYSVTQRRREIGVRMALGALPSSVIRLVLRESGTMIGAGIAAGLVAAALLTRFLAALLYDVAPIDPAVDALVVAVLAGVGLAASLLPAARAARIEPSVVLRGE